MKKQQKSYEPDPLSLRTRRQQRLRRERRVKWFLTLAAILVIIVIAVIIRRFASRHFIGEYKAPNENPTYWFEQTQEILFLTATPTITQTPTATAP